MANSVTQITASNINSDYTQINASNIFSRSPIAFPCWSKPSK